LGEDEFRKLTKDEFFLHFLCFFMIQGQSEEENEVLLARLMVLRDEFEQLPRRGVQMCVILIGPHLIGLLQLYSVSKKVFGEDRLVGKVDQVVESLLKTIDVLLEVIERVDAPFAESLTKSLSRLLSDTQSPSPSSSSKEMVLESSWQSSRLFSKFSEEVRGYIGKIFEKMLKKSSFASITSLSSPSLIPPLFFIVSQLLDIAIHDKNRSNQRQALNAVIQIFHSNSIDYDIQSNTSPIQTDHSSSSSSFSTQSKSSHLNASSSPLGSRFPKIHLASILPGTLSSATRILLGDYKQGQEVFVSAFKLVTICICCILNDDENSSLPSGPIMSSTTSKIHQKTPMDQLRQIMMAGGATKTGNEGKSIGGTNGPIGLNGTSSSSSSSSSSNSSGIGQVDMDEGWYKKASYHVNMVLGRIFSMSRIMSEEVSKNVSMNMIVLKSREVRREMAKSVFSIIRLCRLTLASSFPSLFEILVLFSFDDDEDLGEECKRLLETIVNDFGGNPQNHHFFTSLFSSHISKLIQSIPRISLHPDETKKLLLLRLLTGWMRVFPKIFSSLLPSLIYSLTSFALFNPTQIGLSNTNLLISLVPSSSQLSNSMDNQSFAPLALLQIQQTYHGQFKNFKETKVWSTLVGLLRHLGAVGDLENIFDQLMPSITLSSPLHSEEEEEIQSTPSSIQERIPSSLMLLNEVMMGSSGFLDSSNSTRIKLSRKAKSNLMTHWEHYLMFILSDEVWKGEKKNFSKNDSFKLILIMEGIGNMAMVFGKLFTKYFVQVLYRMLSMAGSDQEILSRVGKMTLIRMAEHTGFSTVIKMVQDNMDYVVEEMIRELRYGEEVKRALKVFGGILSISSSLIVPLLDDLIEDIFKRLDYRQDDMNHSLITILSMVVKIISDKIPPKQPSRLRIRKKNAKVYSLSKGQNESIKTEKMEQKLKSSSSSLNTSKSKESKEMSLSTKKEDVLDDYTMHSWIRRCELEFVGRRDFLEEKKGEKDMIEDIIDEKEFDGSERWKEASSTLDGSKEEKKWIDEMRSMRFKKELVKSYEDEDEGERYEGRGGFGLEKWLKSRIFRRKEESSFSTLPIGEGQKNQSQSVEDYFKEHHAKKEEEMDRGEEEHKGAEEVSKANDEDEMESDEEYEGISYEDDNKQEYEGEGEEVRRRGMKMMKRPHRPGYDIVLKIINRFQHWMNVNDLEMRKKVLETMREGVGILAEHKKVLLPSLHMIWSPLQWRFLDEDYRIVSEALEMMREMSKFGRSFLSRKFVDDLWPLLKAIAVSYNIYSTEGERNIAKMNVVTQYNPYEGGKEKETLYPSFSSTPTSGTKHSSFSSSKQQQDDHHSYLYSSASFKTQYSLLSTITFAVQLLHLPSPITSDIAHNTWFYLAQHQPKPLQEAATKLFSLLLHHFDPSSSFIILSELNHSPITPRTRSNAFIQRHLSAEGGPQMDSHELEPILLSSNLTPKKFSANPSALAGFYAQFKNNTQQILSSHAHMEEEDMETTGATS
jgi:hypothetical protein